jgi:xanthine dehydrogenase accessory factor
MEGSVSGGCVEGAVVEESRHVLAGEAARVLEFGVTDEDAWAVGLACGGRVRIHVAGFPQGLVDVLVEAVTARRRAVLATDLTDGRQALLGEAALANGARSDGPPEAAGDEACAGSGDKGLATDSAVLVAARAAAAEDRSRLARTTDGGEVFLRVYGPSHRLVVVGAVHIAQPLARMAAEVGLDVVVVDPRRAFATEERFPGVSLVREWPEEALEDLAPGRRTAVVTLSHDPKVDDPALVAALASDAFYVGALGSRRTHARRMERLSEAGVSQQDLARIRAPVGLDIGARTPGEIALAILAEVVAARRKGPSATR